jgi:hypothetical protein
MAEETQAAAPALIRFPRRETWLDVPGYPGCKAKIWANYPQRLLNDIRSGEEARIKEALRQVILEHNGWADAEGEALPPPGAPEFWDLIPTELAAILLTLLDDAASTLPNSLMAARRRSRPG